MGALTYLLTWTGYSLLALGLGTVRGCNVTWTQIAWPGRWSGCHPDGGTPLRDPATLDANKGGNKAAGGGSFGAGSPNSPNSEQSLGIGIVNQ